MELVTSFTDPVRITGILVMRHRVGNWRQYIFIALWLHDRYISTCCHYLILVASHGFMTILHSGIKDIALECVTIACSFSLYQWVPVKQQHTITGHQGYYRGSLLTNNDSCEVGSTSSLCLLCCVRMDIYDILWL